MTTIHVETYIHVGKDAVRSHRKVVAAARHHNQNYNAVYPWEFRCQECGTRWGGVCIAVGVDLDKVSCSNCYGDEVRLTKIKIEVLEDSDFATMRSLHPGGAA